ncbi:MAG: hypothetical protein MZW92_62005 [Comamonadaceae bacterium]|nr:hypothetical protein [Comamonadaceae bacterium]
MASQLRTMPPFSPETTRRMPAAEMAMPAQPAGEIRSFPTAVARRAMKSGLVPMTTETADASIRAMAWMKKS